MATAPPDAVENTHAELVDALTEFYTLLDTLGGFLFPDPSSATNAPATADAPVQQQQQQQHVLLPPHPPGSINTDAALEAGFAPEAVALLSALPYLADDNQDFDLLPSTHPLSYLGADMDRIGFEGLREMLYDQLLPPTTIKLTGSSVYGVEWLYDVRTRLLAPYESFENGLPEDADSNDYTRVVTPLPPRQVIGELIEHYRRLDYLFTPRWGRGEVDFSSSLFSEAELDPVTGEAQPPEGWTQPGEAEKFRAMYAVWRATRGIKDIYLECHWDTEAREQPDFRRDEFLRKRAVYWANVVEPLIEVEAGL